MSALVVIPARYGSKRFPGKPLARIGKKSLVQLVYENSMRSRLVSEVVVATDDKRIFDCVGLFGGNALMTSKRHSSGTDRISEAASRPEYASYDIIVNVQGDEPLIKPAMIDAVIKVLDDGRASIGTLAARITNPRDVLDPNVVKIALDGEGFALYFSRSPIPYDRDGWSNIVKANPGGLLKHIGIYGFRREALSKFVSLKTSRLERTEKLEQLRALEAGMRIKVGITRYETLGVDAPGDLRKVEKCLNSYS